MSDELELDMERGRRALAEVRRDVWPCHGGEMPEEPTHDEMHRYLEALEAKVAGSAMAMSLIGRSFRA
jgi:hypothetical protein